MFSVFKVSVNSAELNCCFICLYCRSWFKFSNEHGPGQNSLFAVCNPRRQVAVGCFQWFCTPWKIHHELGHVQYFLQYRNQPIVYRLSACPAFGEAIGDTVAMSAFSPNNLYRIGLIDELKEDKGENLIWKLIMTTWSAFKMEAIYINVQSNIYYHHFHSFVDSHL